MNRKFVLTLVVAISGLASGCASVSGSPNQSIAVQTRDQNGEDVTGANCELYNNKGKWLVITPGSTTVHKSNQDMQISCAKEGMEPGKLSLESKTLGSMYGNIILGGGVGAIIDHNSGAAYEYPSVVRVAMGPPSKTESPAASGQASSPPPSATITGVVQPPAAVPVAPTPYKLAPMAKNRDKKPQVGDEWEYLAEDRLFGKRKKLLWRVKAVDTSGVLEELVVDGVPSTQRLFGNKPDLISAPIDTGFLFGQLWDTQSTLPMLSVSGVGECVRRLNCTVEAKVVGYEQISIAAGSFSAIRIDGSLRIHPLTVPFYGTISVWYSEKDRRLLKQVTQLRAQSQGVNVDESVELQVARGYQ